MSGRVLVYGGNGALGTGLVEFFKNKQWWTLSVDTTPNETADANIVVPLSDSWIVQMETVVALVDGFASLGKFDAILCVAGGWAGGNALCPDLVKNSDLMWKQSVWSSTIAAHIASKYLKEGGLLQLTGAALALEGTDSMIGYGMAKAAVHQLTKSLAADNSGLPYNSTVLAILPVTLNTPMNRKHMTKADQSKWTSIEFVASTLFDWAKMLKERPKNGSLIKMLTVNGKTELISC